MKNIIKITIVLMILLTYGCSGSDDGAGDDSGNDGGNDGSVEEIKPEAATLVFPLKDAECNEGEVISETESTVPFEWNEATSANSYTVSVTNLLTNIAETFDSKDTKLDIKILRGTPYSWKVISRADGSSQTSESEVWNLYNAGPGVENFAPFPAKLISPQMGLSVSTPSINLEWEGSDADEDINEFEVLMDTTSPPTTSITKQGTNTFTATIQLKTVYYWQVITKDSHGNSTKSPVFEFKRI